MTCASIPHNLIMTNIITVLNYTLRNKNCFVFPCDVKVQVEPEKHYTYPDVSIVSGEIQFAQGRSDTIANPQVIIEVMSHTSKDYDRGSKFKAYRKIPTLKDYLLVDQYSCCVEYFHKDENALWVLREYEKMKDTFHILSLKVELALSQIYYQIDFSKYCDNAIPG